MISMTHHERRVAHAPGDAVDARQVDVAHPPHDGVVDDDDGDRRAPDTVAEDQHGDDDGDDRADQPADPGRAQGTGQRRRCARRPSPRRPPPNTARCHADARRSRRAGRRRPEIGDDHFTHRSASRGHTGVLEGSRIRHVTPPRSTVSIPHRRARIEVCDPKQRSEPATPRPPAPPPRPPRPTRQSQLRRRWPTRGSRAS